MYRIAVFERALRGTDAHRRVAAALVVDVRDQGLERFAVLGVAEQEHVDWLDPHVVERELGFTGSAQAHLLVGARDRDPVRGEIDDHRTDSLRSVAAGEAAPDEACGRLVAAGDVVLVGVQPVAVAIGGEPSAHVVDRGAGFGLADPDAEQRLTGRGEGQPAFLECFRAEVLDGPRRAVEGELGEDGARHVGAGELLQDDRRLDVAHPHPAVLLVDGDAEQVGRADRVPGTLGELLGLVPVPGHRCELPLGDIAGDRAQRLLILGFLERVRPPAGHDPER